MSRPEITLIPVAYNSGEQIARTIRHLQAVCRDLPIEIIVVDNASSDDTADQAEAGITDGRVIRLDENIGFGRGANVGIRQAAATRTVVMNDDVMPEEGCVQRLIEVLDSSADIGLVAPRILHPDGSPAPSTRSHLPGLSDELTRLKDFISGADTRNRYPRSEMPEDVELLICAFVMGRSDVLRRLGGFNDSYFIYGEDIDLCARLHSHGLRTVTVPDAVAIHDQDTSPERRFAGRAFVQRILDARDVYYRTWLSRPERIAVNLWRAIGPSDQPFRLRYHLRKAIWDGPNLKHLRQPPSLEDTPRAPG